MIYLIKTTDRISNKSYFSMYIGDTAKLKYNPDPAKKFKNQKLEDDTWSVLAEVVQTFGNKQSFKYVWDTIPEEQKATSLPDKPTKPAYEPSEAKAELENVTDEDLEDIPPLPEDSVEPQEEGKKPAKGKKKK